MNGARKAVDGVAVPALAGAVTVALFAGLSAAGELASEDAPIVWSGLVFGQMVDASLSLAALFTLIRLNRRWPIERPKLVKALAFHAGIVLVLALACMTLFIAAIEVASGAGFDGAREAAVDFGDQLIRMFLLTCIAHLLVRFRRGRKTSPIEREILTSELVIRDSGRQYVQAIAEVRWVDAQGNYVQLHTATGRRLMRGTMQDFEARLGASFLRIHRRTIVNSKAIRQVGRADGGRVIVSLDDGTELSVGRAYAEDLRAFLENGRSSPA